MYLTWKLSPYKLEPTESMHWLISGTAELHYFNQHICMKAHLGIKIQQWNLQLLKCLCIYIVSVLFFTNIEESLLSVEFFVIYIFSQVTPLLSFVFIIDKKSKVPMHMDYCEFSNAPTYDQWICIKLILTSLNGFRSILREPR